MQNNIYILTGPIRSGKTSALANWLNGISDTGGILTPDVDQKRMLYDISNNIYFPFEVNTSTPADELISVGKYFFLKKTFSQAHRILAKSSQNNHWIVVDEVGKLELNNMGFEPALSNLIKHVQKKTNQKLMLVIRDYLLNQCIKKYNLKQANIIDTAYLIKLTKPQNTIGLVMCGGNSMRMGTDKSLLTYFQKPQRYHIYDMLQQICDTAFISCNQTQVGNMQPGYNFIVDSQKYLGAGPLTGLLSAFEKFPNNDFLVVGCDYPFINLNDLKNLISVGKKQSIASCLSNHQQPKHYEPLLALYKSSCSNMLFKMFSAGQHSLNQFLIQVNANQIITTNPKATHSINTMEEFLTITNQL